MDSTQLITYGFAIFVAYALIFSLAALVMHTRSKLLMHLVMLAGVGAVGGLTRWTGDYQAWPIWIQMVVILVVAAPFVVADVRWNPPEE